MSAMEQVLNELRSGRFIMHKLGETLTDLQSQCFKSFSIIEQWRALQSSIATVHTSLEERAKEVEDAKMATNMGMTRLENAVKEVELRQKKLELEETSLRESIEGVELREKELREWRESLESEKRLVLKRLESVALREKCCADAYEQARVVADGVKERSMAVKMKEEELEVREREVKRQREEGVVDNEFKDFAHSMEIELRETAVAEREEALDVKEKELNMKEGVLKVLGQKEEKLEEDRKKLGLKENEMDELYYALELKERENNQTSEMLMSKEKMLRSREEEVEERRKGLELEEKEFEERRKVLDAKEKRILEGTNTMELEQKKMDERSKLMELKEKEINHKSEMLMSKEKMLGLREKAFEEQCMGLELNMKEFEEQRMGLEMKIKEFEDRCEELDVKEKRILEGKRAMELEQKQMDEHSKLMELKEREIEKRFLAVQAKEQQIHKHEQDLAFRDKQLNDLEGIELKEKEFSDQLEETTEEQRDGLCIPDNCIPSHCQAQEVSEKQRGSSLTLASQDPPDTDVHQVASSIQPPSMINVGVIQTLCGFMDAEALGLYLIQYVNNNMLDEYVYDALRYAPDPGKLVLEVSRNFHQEFTDKGQSTDNKNSCILLLEQFTKLSPPITLEVQAAAHDFAAVHWLPRLKATGNTPADTFGYLQFLAAFKLASGYDAYKLLCLFNRLYGHGRLEVYRHERQLSLCRALGVLDMIPAVIKSLIKRNKKLTAVKYICVFKQDQKFPPVPLLEAYLEQKRNEGISKSKNEISELSILQDVTSCIATFKLESKFPPNSNNRPDILISRIKELERKKEERKPDAFKRWKRRSPSSYDSVPSPKQLQKRPRLGN